MLTGATDTLASRVVHAHTLGVHSLRWCGWGRLACMGSSENTYVHGHHESVLRSHTWRTADNSAAYLLPHLRAGQTLLDVGCGPGTITLDLAERVTPGEVVGLDADAGVIETARAAAASAGRRNVRFAVGDVYRLGAADETYDVVHAHQVLQHLSDPVAALREMWRVCRADGWVAARDSDYGAMTWWPEDPRLNRWQELYREVARAAGGEPDAGRRLRSWAFAAGFGSVASTVTAWCFAEPDDRAWWGGLWADRVTSSAFARKALALEATTDAELADLAAGFRAWAANPEGWFAVPHAEVLAQK